MVYKYHQKWRDLRGQDSDVWDVYDLWRSMLLFYFTVLHINKEDIC